MHKRIWVAAFGLVLTGCFETTPGPVGDESPASLTTVVDAGGGEVLVQSTNGASAKLTIPAGALDRNTTISITELEPADDGSPRFDLQPAGLVFQSPVSLSFVVPAGAPLDDLSRLVIEFGGQTQILATTLDPATRTLTATLQVLGGATIAKNTGGNVATTAQLPCSALINTAEGTLQLLQQSPRFEPALNLLAATVSILADAPCSTPEQQGWINTLSGAACDAYTDIRDRVGLILQTDVDDFRRDIGELIYWAGQVQSTGSNCADDFVDVLTDEADDFVVAYAGTLSPPTDASFHDQRREALDLFELRSEFLVMGLESAADDLDEQVIVPVMQSLREAAFDLVRETDNPLFLTRVTHSGFLLPRPVIGGSAPPTPEFIPFFFGFTDEEVFEDIHYAMAAVRIRSADVGGAEVDSVLLGDSLEPGDHVTEANLSIPATGTLELSGEVFRFTCFDGNVVSAEDAIVIKLDGTEVRRISTPGTDGNFLTSAVSLDIAAIALSANVDLTDGAAHVLSIERSRPLNNVFCGEGLLGPSDFELFRVELTVGAAQRFDTLVADDDRSCAITPDGRVKCWGGIAPGDGSNNLNTKVASPVFVQGLTDITDLGSNGNSTLAVNIAGEIFHWGNRGAGGDGTGQRVFDIHATPVKVPGVPPAEQVEVGGSVYCALTRDREVWCWGTGFVGDGVRHDNDVVAPRKINVTGTVEQLVGGRRVMCLRMADRTIQCWGDNEGNELNQADTEADDVSPAPVSGYAGIEQVVAGRQYICALNTSGSVLCGGLNSRGYLGTPPPPTIRGTPQAVPGTPSGVIDIAAHDNACVVTGAGTVHCWGDNRDEVAGVGNTTDEIIPVTQVPGLSNIVEVAAGQEMVCVRSASDQVFCWGDNGNGAVGDGTTVGDNDEDIRTSPTLVLDFP